ncbi:TolC family protein [Parasediminibacterium sp. JCM 36343]|uniref:TolC family protein n=1 Tax=Parasediminibacterium sp. JCM 36343 TaxID=3374279 RepID=UPI00397A8426
MASFQKGKRWHLLAIWLCLPTLSLFAQQKYTLPSLIDSAEHYLPLLQQKTAIIGATKAQVTDTKHSFLPQLRVAEQLNIGSDNSLGGGYFPLGIVPSTSGGIRADNSFQPATGNVAVLYGEYDLATFGLKKAQVDNAIAYTGLANADLQKEKYLLSLNIARLYLNIQKSLYRLKADEQNVDRYQSIYTVIQALTLSGIKAGADSSLAKAELSKTRIGYNQTLGLINQQKQQLAYLTGIPAANLMFDTLVNKTVNTNLAINFLAMDTLGNPLIDFYAKRNAIYNANERVIRKSYLPKILLAGSTWGRGSSIQYNDQYKGLQEGLGYQRFNYMVGVAVTYNLFDELHKKDKLAINHFQQQAGDYELQQQKLALASASLQADNALQTTEANLREIPVQLASAEATYQQKVAQYKAGLISLIDLTNASFVLYRSQTDYIETRSDWYLAQLDKAAATGNLNQFIQTIK